MKDAAAILTEQIAQLTRERDIYKAGFIAASKVIDEFVAHLAIRGGRMEPLPECVAAQSLVDGGTPTEDPVKAALFARMAEIRALLIPISEQEWVGKRRVNQAIELTR